MRKRAAITRSAVTLGRMVTNLVWVMLGLFLLYIGAEWLVKGAAGLARAFGIAPLVVGLTVVAYGTSAPELVVSTVAAIEGRGAIAVANVIGSNIANLALILGLTALISPPQVDPTLIRREVPVLVLTAFVGPQLLWNDQIGRLEAVGLVLGAIAFTWWTVATAKKVSPDSELREEVRAEVAEEAGTGSRLKLAGFALFGLAVLVGGGKVFVDGAVGLALALGMSERVVGLTIVAVGTSLPELATSVIAALRGHSAIAIGNVVGSNIFNMLLILGLAGVIRPFEVSFTELRVDAYVMIGVSLLAAVLLRTARRINRVEGGLLLLTYGVYLAFLAGAF